MIRVVFGILLVPMLLIAGAIAFLLLALFAYTVHVLLTIVPIAIGGLVLYAVARWEKQRYDRDQPH